jgi:hypothetical protein
MNLGLDPKIVVLALIVIAGLIYYFTSGSQTVGSSSLPVTANVPAVQEPGKPARLGRAEATRRANALRSERAILHLVPVDGSRGDIDPTLRLGLLERVKNVPQATGSRNLFDAGNPMTAPDAAQIAKNAPRIIPQTPLVVQSAVSTPPPSPPFNIPLKYYGFVKPNAHSLDGNRGFFIDGDNILVGGEGDVLEKKFLIVALTPNAARLEDIEAKQGQELPVTPEAPPSQ